jgi:hypothetical protein
MVSSTANYITPTKPAGIANVSVPFFTTDPACCNNPRAAYNGMMIYQGGGFAR